MMQPSQIAVATGVSRGLGIEICCQLAAMERIKVR